MDEEAGEETNGGKVISGETLETRHPLLAGRPPRLNTVITSVWNFQPRCN